MARLATQYAAAVLEKQGLAPLVKFSGSNGFHLMWNVPDCKDLSEAALWEIEQRVVSAIACETEKLLGLDEAFAGQVGERRIRGSQPDSGMGKEPVLSNSKFPVCMMYLRV